jgi:hypothetical protein
MMLNSNTLDTVIAMVIVLLILSLVVQSVQQGLKKLLKIKSRQIEDSLVDLFEHILDEKPNVPDSWWERMVQNSPFLRIFGGKHPSEHNDKVKKLYCDVTEKFQQAGRVTQTGKLMLDSIAKQDLVKVLGTVAPSVLTPDYEKRIEAAIKEFEKLAETIKDFNPSEFSKNLSEDAKEKLAQMQGALRPLVNDITAYLEGDTVPGATAAPDVDEARTSGQAGGAKTDAKDGTDGDVRQKKIVNSTMLLQDIMKLRTLRLEDVSHLISEAEKSVEEQLARARQDPDGGLAAAALSKGGDTLRVLARGVADFDRTINQLLASLTKAEQWFDTVMQSFEERYARGMKTWGVIISLVVVILLNANFFDVYKNIAGNDTLRANIVQMRDDLAKRYEESAVKGDKDAAKTLQELYRDTAQDVSSNASLYTGLGFTPIWQSPPKGFFHSLIGWMIMTLLLSVGAPFWQDTLESLFGLKNVLRKQSDTKNVENKGGQPKP